MSQYFTELNKRFGPLNVHGIVADLGEAEQTFDFRYRIRQFLRKLGMALGGFDEVRQFLGNQTFQCVVKSKLVLYA